METSIVELAIKLFIDLTNIFRDISKDVKDQTMTILGTFTDEIRREKGVSGYRVIVLNAMKKSFETIEDIIDKGIDIQKEIELQKEDLNQLQMDVYLSRSNAFCDLIKETKRYADIISELLPNRDTYVVIKENNELKVVNTQDNSTVFTELLG